MSPRDPYIQYVTSSSQTNPGSSPRERFINFKRVSHKHNFRRSEQLSERGRESHPRLNIRYQSLVPRTASHGITCCVHKHPLSAIMREPSELTKERIAAFLTPPRLHAFTLIDKLH